MSAVNSPTESKQPKVYFVEINEDHAGQRIDNFLLARLKGVPKSRIYKILRSGEVRINKGRAKPGTKLSIGDVVRIPPVRVADKDQVTIPDSLINQLNQAVLFENDDLIIINKPAGLAVHAGSNIKFGVIDVLRASRFKDQFIELAHRLDRQTSGCLVLAKSREALTHLNRLMTNDDSVDKRYLALTEGHWPQTENNINLPLRKNENKGGERMVIVSEDGKQARSLFSITEVYKNCSLVEVKLFTGRTHQIRVHASHNDHPVAGDEKYGSREFNKLMKKVGLKRMFLHARSIEFDFNGPIKAIAPLDASLQNTLILLRENEKN